MNFRVFLVILLGIAFIEESYAKEPKEASKFSKQNLRLSRARSKIRPDDEIGNQETGNKTGTEIHPINDKSKDNADKKPASDDDKKSRISVRKIEKKNRKLLPEEDKSKRRISVKSERSKTKKSVEDVKEKEKSKKPSDDEKNKSEITSLKKNGEKTLSGELGKLLSPGKEGEPKMADRTKRSIYCIEIKPNGECVQPVQISCPDSAVDTSGQFRTPIYVQQPAYPIAQPQPIPVAAPTEPTTTTTTPPPTTTTTTTTTTPAPCPEPVVLEKQVQIVVQKMPPSFLLVPPEPPKITRTENVVQRVPSSSKSAPSNYNAAPPYLASYPPYYPPGVPTSGFYNGVQAPSGSFNGVQSSSGYYQSVPIYNWIPQVAASNGTVRPASGPASGGLPVPDASQPYPPAYFQFSKGNSRGNSYYPVDSSLTWTENVPPFFYAEPPNHLQMRMNEIDAAPLDTKTIEISGPVAIVAPETDPLLPRMIAEAYPWFSYGYPPTALAGRENSYPPSSMNSDTTKNNETSEATTIANENSTASTPGVESSNVTGSSPSPVENSSRKPGASMVRVRYVPYYHQDPRIYDFYRNTNNNHMANGYRRPVYPPRPRQERDKGEEDKNTGKGEKNEETVKTGKDKVDKKVGKTGKDEEDEKTVKTGKDEEPGKIMSNRRPDENPDEKDEKSSEESNEKKDENLRRRDASANLFDQKKIDELKKSTKDAIKKMSNWGSSKSTKS